jgi:hypothetical protein
MCQQGRAFLCSPLTCGSNLSRSDLQRLRGFSGSSCVPTDTPVTAPQVTGISVVAVGHVGPRGGQHPQSIDPTLARVVWYVRPSALTRRNGSSTSGATIGP